MSLVDRCGTCCELITRCTCESNPVARGIQPLPEDPDEAMQELRGCTVAEYNASLERYLARGYA